MESVGGAHCTGTLGNLVLALVTGLAAGMAGLLVVVVVDFRGGAAGLGADPAGWEVLFFVAGGRVGVVGVGVGVVASGRIEIGFCFLVFVFFLALGMEDGRESATTQFLSRLQLHAFENRRLWRLEARVCAAGLIALHVFILDHRRLVAVTAGAAVGHGIKHWRWWSRVSRAQCDWLSGRWGRRHANGRGATVTIFVLEAAVAVTDEVAAAITAASHANALS